MNKRTSINVSASRCKQLVTRSCRNHSLVHMVAYSQREAWEDSLVVGSPAVDNPSNSLGCSIPYHRSPDIHRNITHAISIQSQYVAKHQV